MSNEESTTVSGELNKPNAELGRLNNELVNFISSVDMAIVMVGPDLRVRRYTPVAEKLLNLLPMDIGRPLADVKLNLQHLPPLQPLLMQVMESADGKEFEVQDASGHWYSMRLRPYCTSEKTIDGVVLMLVDVDAVKQEVAVTAHLGAIVRSSDDAIISKSLDSIITSWNKGAERLLGYTAQEAIGQPMTLLIPPDRVNEEPGILQRIRSGESIDHYETVRQCKNRTLLDVSLSVSPVRNASGQIIGAASIMRDTTERKRAEQALRRSAEQFQTLLYEAPLGVYVVDSDFRIRHVNPTTFKVFGDLDVMGRDFDEVIHILWPKAYADEIVQRFRHTLETGEPYVNAEHTEGRIDRDATEVYEWRISRIPLPEGRYGVVCYFRDIAEQVRVRQALIESDRRKNEFLAMLAHELRNPLAPIRNALHVIQRNGADAKALASSCAMMERQVGQMVRLVDDLLDVSRISRGTIEPRRERVELSSVVYHAVEASRPAMDLAQHVLTITMPPKPIYLDADPTRLAQIVGNLLNNAGKFTDNGGRIALTVELDGGQVAISVRDNGVGIAADQLARIFDMFVQVNTSLERSVSGLGIGLTLVKTLVELHGGTVQAYSAGLGHGSEFQVRFPIMPDGPIATARAPAAAASPSHISRRVLVVDDNHDSAESLALLLEMEGDKTQTAHDGLTAIESAAVFRPEIILLDLGLPKLNGYEVCRRIREQPWGKRMVLVALTGWGQEEDRRKTDEAGFDGHLVKPVDYGMLLPLLASLISKRGA